MCTVLLPPDVNSIEFNKYVSYPQYGLKTDCEPEDDLK